MGLPDVVYVVRNGDNNEELRHSLRTLTNVPHRDVWIVGYRPKWLTNVGHIPVRQDGSKWANSTANVRAACEHPDVADDYLLFNDDFFVLRPVDRIEPAHRGPVAKVLSPAHGPSPAGSYRVGAAQTAKMLQLWGHPDPLSYELHIPLPVDKTIMLDCLDRAVREQAIRVLHKRTLYGNVAGLGGAQMADVKLSRVTSPVPDGALFVSTNDRSFTGQPGRTIRAMFPDPSPYEKG